jgi:hypothetical protein
MYKTQPTTRSQEPYEKNALNIEKLRKGKGQEPELQGWIGEEKFLCYFFWHCRYDYIIFELSHLSMLICIANITSKFYIECTQVFSLGHNGPQAL